MEFLKLVRRRSFLSEAVYMVLNIALAIAVLAVIRYTESIPLALLLVIISKWRVFAVRPRYWFANLRSNLVDFIVSVSVVLHMFTINNADIAEGNKLILLAILTLLYIAWLLFLKPRSKRIWVGAQAGVAMLSGSAALFTVSYAWPVSAVVIGMWLIGFSAAQHILNTYDDENHGLFISLVWGLVVAELSWIAFHAVVAYNLPFVNSLLVPQISILITVLGFVVIKAYDSFYHHQKIRTNDIILPVFFLIALMISLWFALPSIQCGSSTVLLCLEYL